MCACATHVSGLVQGLSKDCPLVARVLPAGSLVISLTLPGRLRVLQFPHSN